jgi:glucose/mannose-6-phosphate isomerase
MTIDKSIDSSNMLKSIYDFPFQMKEAKSIGERIELKNTYENVQNIVLCGMGGSAIGGDLSRSLVNESLTVPMFVNRNYSLPNWVNSNSLVIASSYSGNTEETLSAYHEAISKGAKVIGVTTGGELASLIDKNKNEKVLIPAGLQPRAAVAFSFIPLLYLLKKLSITNSKALDELDAAIEKIQSVNDIYSLDNEKNPTYVLAKEIYRTIPVIYGENEMTSTIALRWKGQFCENSKMLAYHNDLPEMNHNEIVGWQENPKLLKQISILWISDQSCNARNSLRLGSTKDILGSIPAIQKKVELDGASFTERFIHLLHFGDWISYWCALLHIIDPTPVTNIDKLKKILSEKS